MKNSRVLVRGDRERTLEDLGIIGTAQTPDYAIYASFRGAINKNTSGAALASDAPDLSGYGGEVNVMNQLGVDAWAAPGYLSIGGGAGKGASIQKRKAAFNLATDSVVIAFVINVASGVAGTIMGNGSTPTGGALQGLAIALESTGKLSVAVKTSAGDATSQLAERVTKTTVADGTDHAILVAIDGPRGGVFIYVDGVLEAISVSAFTGNTANIASNWNLGIAGLTQSLTTVTPRAIKLRGAFHLVKRAGALPLAIGEMARRHAQGSTAAFGTAETAPPLRTWYVEPAGQSNEAGQGERAASSGLKGAPVVDPLPGLGGPGSEWPKLAGMLGQKGIWAQFGCSAVGSTSVVHNWVGILRAYSNGQFVTRGTYVLNGGNVYKNVSGTQYQTTPIATSVPPVHTAGIIAGADNISWEFKGAARSQDVAGYVYPPSDAYFDPNGFIAAAMGRILSKTGYDDRFLFFRIGHGDAGLGTVRAEFASGLRYVAQRALDAGIKVMLGMASYSGSNAGDDQRYIDQLMPGWEDAVRSFSGDRRVIRAANLRAVLGPLTPNVAADQIGMKDVAHMNDVTLTLAAEADLDAIWSAVEEPIANGLM